MKELHFIIGKEGPSHLSGRFVEVEDETGASRSIGTWKEIDGLWHLVVPVTGTHGELCEPCLKAGEIAAMAGLEANSLRRRIEGLEAKLAETGHCACGGKVPKEGFHGPESCGVVDLAYKPPPDRRKQ